MVIRQQLLQSVSKFSPYPKPSDITPQQVLSECSGHIQHQHYNCPLYYWASQLWVKQSKEHSKPLWVVYVEYRNPTRSCCYQPFYFKSLQQACQFISMELSSCHLPNISPKVTRESPVKFSH